MTVEPSKVSEIQKAIEEDLNAIVDSFNKDFDAWYRRSKCYANFRWVYKGDSKVLEVSEITLPVKTSEPSEEAIQKAEDILNHVEPKS